MELVSVSVVFGALAAVIVVIVALFWCVRRQHHKQKRTQGIIWIQALRSMLMHIQRHRGLSATFLAGEHALVSELEASQRCVSRDLGHIALVGDWIKDNPHWEAITAHWARLAGQYQRLDVRKNLDQHNRLIKSILVFIDDVADEHFLTPVRGHARASWRNLLSVAEDLGQIRAVGMAYIACLECGENSPRMRNSLQALVSEFEACLEQGAAELTLSKEEQQQARDFVHNYPLALLVNPASCPVTHYYQAATEVMDALYLHFDDELMQVQRTLS
jgi:hypothetical protein